MPYQVGWLEPNQVISILYYNELTIHELRAATLEATEIVRAVPTTCTNLIDMRHVKKYPFDIREVLNKTSDVYRDPDAYTALLTHNTMITFFAKTVMRFMDLHLHVYRETPDAFTFLKEMHPTATLPTPATYDGRLQALVSGSASLESSS